MNLLLNLLILLVVAVVVFYAAKYGMDQAELDPPVRKIVLLVLFVVFLIALVNLLSGGFLWAPIVLVR